MKKFVLVFAFAFASHSAFADVQADFEVYWNRWIEVQSQFTQAMGYAETSDEAVAAVDQLLKEYERLRIDLAQLESLYPCRKGEPYNSVFLEARSAMYKKNASVDPMYGISVIKFSKFVKKDSTLQEPYKSLTDATQTMKKLNSAS